MKLSIDKTILSNAIDKVIKAISSKIKIPILEGILFQVSEQGLRLTASDADITISVVVPADDYECDSQGSVVIPAAIFNETIHKMTKSEIEINIDFSSLQIKINSGRFEASLTGMDAEEYPRQMDKRADNSFSIKGSVLEKLIKQSVFATSKNEAMPILMGINVSLKNNELKIIATDRHRMAKVIEVNETQAVIESTIISGKSMTDLSKVVDRDEIVEIAISSFGFYAKSGNCTFQSRIIEGIFPDTERIVPTIFKTEILVSTREFIESLEFALVYTKEGTDNKHNLVSVSFDNEISFQSKNGSGQKSENTMTATKFTGEPMKLSFNIKYVLDALKAIESDKVEIKLTGLMSPIIFTAEGVDKSVHLILPYKTTD